MQSLKQRSWVADITVVMGSTWLADHLTARLRDWCSHPKAERLKAIFPYAIALVLVGPFAVLNVPGPFEALGVLVLLMVCVYVVRWGMRP